MKTRLFFAICLFFAVFTAKGQPQTPADLKLGDWMELEYITFLRDSTPGDIWRAEDVFKIRFQGTVIRKTAKEVAFSFKPVHLYKCTLGAKVVIVTPTPGNRMYIHGNTDSYTISDSYFKDFNEDFLISNESSQDFRDDFFMFSIQLSGGSIQDTLFHLQSDLWKYRARNFTLGLQKNHYGNSGYSFGMVEDAKSTFHNAVLGYFSQWFASDGKDMPEIVNLQYISGFIGIPSKFSNQHFHGFPDVPVSNDRFVYSDPKMSSIVRLADASFDRKPNLVLIFKSMLPRHGQLTITVKGNKYTFKQKDNNLLECRFYLSSPSKAVFDGVNMLLTPGDSIHIEKDESDTYIFTGKGAGNCMYAQEEQNLLRMFRSTYDEFPARVEKMTTIYNSLWNKYRNKMNDYWLKSSQLSYKYWYISTYLENREKLGYGRWYGIPIPWNDPQFVTAMPHIDYIYQPDHYERFIKEFWSYKLEQLHADNMTSFKGFGLDREKSDYYIGRELFSGYPRLLLMKNTLTGIMQKNHYSKYQQEYDDFMQTCFKPELRHEINDLHRQLMQIDPGRKIQDIHPELAKLHFLKNKADGYIMLNTKINKSLESDLVWTRGLWKALKNNGLSDRMKVIALRSKEFTESLPDSLKNPNQYLYLLNDDNKITIDKDFFSFFNGEFILLRNDGTIVSREITSGGSFRNLPDIIRADRAERDRKPEKSYKTLWWVLFATLCSGGIVLAIATLRVKLIRRREKNKRLMTELELKAIRSQMNPHFVFNALGSIQSLINQEKTADANHYLVNFARLLRMTLSSADKKLTSLADELEQLELYLRLEQLRVPFVYHISVAKNVQPANEEIPGMLIQPIVENAVIHGIVPRQGGQIDIRISREENILLMEVADDGAGFADNALQKNGFGIRAINERLALLNDELKTNIGLKFENRQKKEGVSGTRVTISVER